MTRLNTIDVNLDFSTYSLKNFSSLEFIFFAAVIMYTSAGKRSESTKNKVFFWSLNMMDVLCSIKKKCLEFQVSVFCSGTQFLLYLDYSYVFYFFQEYCYGQTRLAAGVTGKSRRVGATGQAKRSGIDPPGEDEEKRKGGKEESDMGGRDLEH